MIVVLNTMLRKVEKFFGKNKEIKMCEYSEMVLKRVNKTESERIEAAAFHHFKFCEFCIPGALDMPEEQRLCPEGLSYLSKMREAKKKE